MKIKIPICPVGQPTLKRRIYSEDDWKALIGAKAPVYIDSETFSKGVSRPDEICGTVTVNSVESDTVYGVLEVIDSTLYGRIVADIISQNEASFSIVPCGTGCVDENGVVSDYTLLGFGFVAGSNDCWG